MWGKCMGDRLLRARLARGLTQTQLAQIVGCFQKDIHLWENGREPKVRTLKRLAIALECTMDELVPDPDDPKV